MRSKRMSRPEQCMVELLYKQTREDNQLDYSTEIGGIYAWVTVFEPGREMELVDKILTILCDPKAHELGIMDIEDIICPIEYEKNAE